jgi:hypothetical protein
MSRLRVLAALAVLVVAGLLVPASPAAAAAQLSAFITCDGETGAITTWASGNLLVPGTPKPVTVEFQRSSGTRVTATTSNVLAPTVPTTVTVQSTSTGDVSAIGYTGSFDPVTSLYYREKVLVTFKNAATGAVYTTRDASCDYDQRTTVNVDCDPVAGTVTATVTGINGQAGSSSGNGRPTSVSYHPVRTIQNSATDPRFRGEVLGPWEFSHRVTRAADGTWADTAFVDTVTSNPYYYAVGLTVGVFDAYGTQIGGGSGRCTLFDGSQTS